MDEPSDSPPPDPTQPIGVVLARLRKGTGRTGDQLGRQVGMSQAKISKIETGAVTPSANDIRRIARSLGVAPAETERLIELAQQPRDSMTDLGRKDTTTWQRDVAELEREATTFRVFQPAVLSGLLQTSEYARAVFNTAPDYSSAPFDMDGQRGISAAVTARIKRQEVLEDRSKQFHFIVPETLLENVLVQAEEMPVQLSRLRDVAHQDNVTLSLITDGTRWPYPPLHGFSLLDDQYVIIDLFNTAVISRGRADTWYYRQVFDALEGVATRNVDPILDKYRRMYLRLAQES